MMIVSPSRGLMRFPIDGKGADIQAGAMVMPGITTSGSGADDGGCIVLADETAADVVGVLVALHDYSEVGDSDTYTGAANVMAEVDPFYPGCLVAVEYDLTDTMAIATMTSTVKVAVSSIIAEACGGWLYCYSGTGVGQLAFVKYNDNTDLYLKSALTTAWIAADSTLVHILPLFWKTHNLIATMDKFGTDAAAGTFYATTLRNQFKYDGQEGWIDLDPGLHHNLQLNGLHPVFRSIGNPADTMFAPLS